jgi:type III restriction enzyme
MDNQFFERPILNSPYSYPERHWELDGEGQPTQKIIETRRRAEFITPIPKPKKQKRKATQDALVFDEGKGLSTEKQQYDPTSIINELRYQVDQWRKLPSPNDWQVTPETERLLQHWRHHKFSTFRPFFCQVEAVETAIWLIEVAPKMVTPAWSPCQRRGPARYPRPMQHSGEYGHRRGKVPLGMPKRLS